MNICKSAGGGITARTKSLREKFKQKRSYSELSFAAPSTSTSSLLSDTSASRPGSVRRPRTHVPNLFEQVSQTPHPSQTIIHSPEHSPVSSSSGVIMVQYMHGEIPIHMTDLQNQQELLYPPPVVVLAIYDKHTCRRHDMISQKYSSLYSCSSCLFFSFFSFHNITWWYLLVINWRVVSRVQTP